jgi:ribosomal protein S18 acetylase RimI-like enzyme
MEIVTYQVDFQEELEKFLKQTNASPKFPFDPAGRHQDFRKIPETYQTNNGQFWVLLLSSVPVGIIALKALSESLGEVKRLNVHPDHRGKGYGELLLKHLLDYAVKMDFKKIRLDSIRELNPAYNLYKKIGFYEISRYNDNPNADIFMEIDIA